MAEGKITDLPDSAQAYLKKGNEALQQNNLDDAMDVFEAVLEMEPRLLEVRRKLRESAIQNENSASRSQSWLPPATYVQVSALAKTNPVKALPLAEKLVRTAPFNSEYLNLLCDALIASGLPEAAIMTLETTLSSGMDDCELLERLAELYRDVEDFSMEYECWTKVIRLNPNDANALKNIKDAASRLAMGKTGWEKAESIREAMQDKETTDNGHAKLQQKLKQNPDDVDALKEIAQLQFANRDYDAAIESMEHFLSLLNSPDEQIERKLALAREHQLSGQLAEAEDAQDFFRVSALRKKMQTLRIAHHAKQVGQNPHDLSLRFEYGKLLFENQRFTEAISEFETAKRNPQREIRSRIYLAGAFKETGQNERAIESLNRALQNLTELSVEKREVLHLLDLLTKNNDLSEA